jgi:hypothetical protein
MEHFFAAETGKTIECFSYASSLLVIPALRESLLMRRKMIPDKPE